MHGITGGFVVIMMNMVSGLGDNCGSDGYGDV